MKACAIDVINSFFFNDTATTEIYTLSLHDALPILATRGGKCRRCRPDRTGPEHAEPHPSSVIPSRIEGRTPHARAEGDRKSTRLNSSHANISYAVFCLKKNKNNCYAFF